MKHLLLSTLALAVAMPPSTFANTVTWTGGNGGFGYQWIDSCWDAGSKPGSGDIARFVDIQRFIDRINAGAYQSIALAENEEISGLQFDNTYGVTIQGNFRLTLASIAACDSDRATTNNLNAPLTLVVDSATFPIQVGESHTLSVSATMTEPENAGNGFLRTGAGTLLLSGALGFTGDVWFKEGYTRISNNGYPTLKGKGVVRIGGDAAHPAVLETTAATHALLHQGTDFIVLPGGTFRGPERASAASWTKEYLSVDHGVLDGADSLNIYVQDLADTPDRGREIHLTGGVMTNLLLGISWSASDTPTLFGHAAEIPSVLAGTLDPNPLTFDVERGTAPVDLVGLFRVTGGHGPIHKTGSGIMAIDTPEGITGFQMGTKISTVRGGTLLLNNTSGSGVGTNDVQVYEGAVFGGTGRQFGAYVTNRGLKGNVELHGASSASRATFAPGDIDRETGAWIPGTFTLGLPAQTNNLVSAGYGELRCVVDKTGASCLAVNGRLQLSATDRLAIVGPATIPAGTFTLATFTNGFANRFADVTVNGVDLASAKGKVAYLDAQGAPIAAASYDGAGSIVYTVPETETVIVFR